MPFFSLNQCHDSALVVGTNHGIAFPMTHLSSIFNMQGAFAQRPSLGDLPSAFPFTCIALPLLLLVLQVLPKRTALSFVCINMLVNSFMADGQQRQSGQEALNTKYPQRSNHQLIKASLLA